MNAGLRDRRPGLARGRCGARRGHRLCRSLPGLRAAHPMVGAQTRRAPWACMPAPVVEEGARIARHGLASARWPTSVPVRAWIGRGAVIGSGAMPCGRRCAVGEPPVLKPRDAARRRLPHRPRAASCTAVRSSAPMASASRRTEAGAWEKIEQLGGVLIGDDVEIGANTCIDRGALEDTVLEDGVKLDNLVQIGHNVRVGAHTAFAGCVGVAGSARIGAALHGRWRRHHPGAPGDRRPRAHHRGHGDQPVHPASRPVQRHVPLR